MTWVQVTETFPMKKIRYFLENFVKSRAVCCTPVTYTVILHCKCYRYNLRCCRYTILFEEVFFPKSRPFLKNSRWLYHVAAILPCILMSPGQVCLSLKVKNLCAKHAMKYPMKRKKNGIQIYFFVWNFFGSVRGMQIFLSKKKGSYHCEKETFYFSKNSESPWHDNFL